MRAFIFLLGSFFLYSCKKPEKQFTLALNDIFLSITDTVAYQQHRFFLVPGEPSEPAINTFLNICIEQKIIPANELIQYLKAELSKADSLNFKRVLQNGIKKNQHIESIYINELKNTGRYHLIAAEDCGKDKTPTVGSIKFYEPVMENDKAIIFASISSSEKAGFTNAWLVTKENGKWFVQQKIELERW
jgi:hypothetical protein